MKRQINFRASNLTVRQLEELGELWGTSQTETISLVVDRIYREETVMDGYRISQMDADKALEEGLEVYQSPSEGIFVRRPDSLFLGDAERGKLQRVVGYNLGHSRRIPSDAFRLPAPPHQGTVPDSPGTSPPNDSL